MSLSCGLLMILLIQYGGYSLLTLLSYLALLQLLICFIFINGTNLFLQATQRSRNDRIDEEHIIGNSNNMDNTALLTTSVHVDMDEVDYNYIPQSLVLEYSGYITDVLNATLNHCARILRCRDNIETIEVMIILVCLSILGRILDGVTMLGLLYISLFFLPKLYLKHTIIIDQKMKQIRQTSQFIRSQVKQLLPGIL